MFKRLVHKKYIIAIIDKEDFKKGRKYHRKFYETFDKSSYKKIIPKLTDLFRKLNGGKLKSTVIVNFDGSQTPLKDIDYKMVEALRKLDYEVNEDSYKTGMVFKKGKQIPILDVLNTKATKVRGYEKLKDQYEKTKNEHIKKELDFYDHLIKMDILDPTQKIDVRKLSIYDNKKSKIVFTYNHRAIASQSTKVGWSSCMNLDAGSNYGYMGKGASSGEFVAFLAKAGDEYTLESPTARVLFKPYFGKNTKDVIWRADKTYGTASGFREYAQHVIDKYIRAKQDTYKINPNSYNDDLPSEHIHITDIDKALDDKDVEVRRAAIQHPNANEKHIDKALDDEDDDVRLAAIKHPKANEKHIDKAIDDENWRLRLAAILHPNANEKHIDKAIDDKDGYVRRAAIKHPKSNEKHIDKAIDDKDGYVREAALKHPKATEKHIDKAIDDEDDDVRLAALKHPKSNEKHIDKAIDDKDSDVRRAARKRKNEFKGA